jgi:hypothetical protein
VAYVGLSLYIIDAPEKISLVGTTPLKRLLDEEAFITISFLSSLRVDE